MSRNDWPDERLFYIVHIIFSIIQLFLPSFNDYHDAFKIEIYL